jgi:hypothetical protein
VVTQPVFAPARTEGLVATAKQIRGRRRQAWGRLPVLLAAWAETCKELLVVGKDRETSIPGVVWDEIKRFQGFVLPPRLVYYESGDSGEPEIAHEMGNRPEEYEVLIALDNRVLRLIARGLRLAWREATRGERAPSLGGLNRAKGLHDCLEESLAHGLKGERAIRRVVGKVEAVEARWKLAIEQYRQKTKRRKRSRAAAGSVPPQYVIFETDKWFKFEIEFTDKRRSKGPAVHLTRQEFRIYKIVRERRQGDDGGAGEFVTYNDICKCVWDNSYAVLVATLGEEKVRQNIRAAVSRFNRAWFKATKDRVRILTPLRKSPGTWAVRPVKIMTPEEREEKRFSRRRLPPTE